MSSDDYRDGGPCSAGCYVCSEGRGTPYGTHTGGCCSSTRCDSTNYRRDQTRWLEAEEKWKKDVVEWLACEDELRQELLTRTKTVVRHKQAEPATPRQLAKTGAKERAR